MGVCIEGPSRGGRAVRRFYAKENSVCLRSAGLVKAADIKLRRGDAHSPKKMTEKGRGAT